MLFNARFNPLLRDEVGGLLGLMKLEKPTEKQNGRFRDDRYFKFCSC